jgi:hypothetical protein
LRLGVIKRDGDSYVKVRTELKKVAGDVTVAQGKDDGVANKAFDGEVGVANIRRIVTDSDGSVGSWYVKVVGDLARGVQIAQPNIARVPASMQTVALDPTIMSAVLTKLINATVMRKSKPVMKPDGTIKARVMGPSAF